MPRITAATLAAHHAQRKAALLSAGRELLSSAGAGAVTPAAVGARAGLARSSVYQYFDSTATLLLAIVEDTFPDTAAALRSAVSAHTEPLAQVDAYLAAAFTIATNADHQGVTGLNPADLPPEVWSRIQELHDDQRAPLLEALEALGIPDPDLVSRFALGLLATGARAVLDGADAGDVLAALQRAVTSGLLT